MTAPPLRHPPELHYLIDHEVWARLEAGGACADALAVHGIDPTGLIAECSGRGGAVQFMARALNLRWRALVF